MRAVGTWQAACVCGDAATCGTRAAHELIALAALSLARPVPYAALVVWPFAYLGTLVTVCFFLI